MIHYHGLPITPDAAATALSGGHAFVSYAHPSQIGLALEICSTVALDNGAFSAWKSGQPISDWTGYYDWVCSVRLHPAFAFAVVPDVIDGDEDANDALAAEWPFPRHEAAVVWHLHESLERLDRLAEWPRVALGSSGDYATIGTPQWWRRIAEAMNVICDADGQPRTRLHGLRMLDPEVFTRLPFASADSTNIARNIGFDGRWRGSYAPPTKAARVMLMRQRIEAHQSAARWSEIHHLAQEVLAL